MSRPAALVFDLGGVLVEFAGFNALCDLLGAPGDATALKARWLRSPAVRAFELGRIAPAEFGTRFVEEWALEMSAEAFLAQFDDWLGGMHPGAPALLGRLRAHYRLACLSNSNPLHWPRLGGVTDLFDHAFSSHLTGLIKPERAAFTHAVDTLGVPPAAVLFFDDAHSNVAAARDAGIEALHVDGFDALVAALADRGIL
jgi:putative hydrolase of the HAD superfamily